LEPLSAYPFWGTVTHGSAVPAPLAPAPSRLSRGTAWHYGPLPVAVSFPGFNVERFKFEVALNGPQPEPEKG
jgi:hypothetical protein